MRRLLHALFQRMLVKIFAALGLVVGSTLLFLAWRQSDAEIHALKNETKQSAQKIADVVLGSIEHSMLQGNGVEVMGLVRSVRRRVPDSEIHIFDPRGVEVFGEKPPAPARSSLSPDLGATLADGQRRIVGERRVLRPIANEERCHLCHDDRALLRGVLEIDLLGVEAKRDEIIAALVEDAFIRVMTAEQKDLLDDYFAALSKDKQPITGVSVYDAEGDRSFGEDIPGITAESLRPSLVPSAPRKTMTVDGRDIVVIPLPMQERCRQCHDETSQVRGVIAVALARPVEGHAPQDVETVIDTSLRVIMLSSLGRMITGFLDTVVSTGAASTVTLYDNVGRLFYTTAPAHPAPQVADALASKQTGWSVIGVGATERVQVVRPLTNDKQCHRCHGSRDAVRGAATVSLSTGHAAALREKARMRAALFMAFALVAILTLLYVLLSYLVITPVRQIGDVAEAVGRGNLDVNVSRAHPEGDEVSRLGHRINHMIEGLRTELHMRRFVSKTTAAAARGAARDAGSSAHVQMRRPSTVLFTDIRGFTAYSETVDPERVVEMLNRLLQAQADVVDRYHGDIDKYVGDELMAVFEGDDADARAVRCAVEMVEAVDLARTSEAPMRVGAGISRGDMVHGPIGSKNRQDFTVIGDVVNIGARLCSNAAPGDVIISQAVRDACDPLDGLVFEPLDPLALKGKREPFAVFRVRRA